MRVAVGGVSLFFEVFGREWRVEQDGPRCYPVLVGLHGGPGIDGGRLRHYLAPLADVAQVVVPDQRGHGRSDHGTADTWNLATWSADVKRLCDALGIEHPIVLGSSFGGAVAQAYAAAYPSDPAGLILVSTGPRFPGTEDLVAGFREVGGDEAADVVRRDLEEATEETLAEWQRVCVPLLSRNPSQDPDLARVQAAAIQTPKVNLHFMSGEVKTLDLRPELAGVRCPTLVLTGEHDPLAPAHSRDDVVAAMPEGLARLELVPDASHDVFNDNPDHAYRCVRKFIAGLG